MLEVGFQGEDPLTDFRGLGRLGYKNLVHLVRTNPQKTARLLATARDLRTEFFFARASTIVTFF